jgi:hypothetical protein
MTVPIEIWEPEVATADDEGFVEASELEVLLDVAVGGSVNVPVTEAEKVTSAAVGTPSLAAAAVSNTKELAVACGV